MVTKRLYVVAGLTAWGVLLIGSVAWSQIKEMPIVIGESRSIYSTILHENRSISIYKPEGYDNPTGAYPVLYLLDGDVHFLHMVGLISHRASLGLMPKMLIVGIANTDRGRDMTPIPHHGVDQDFPTGGGASQFLTFINQELKPFIKAHYRTEPYELLVGTSLSGLFVINTLLTQPDAFNAYVAISPSLWWDKQAVSLSAEAILTKPVQKNTFLYFTLCPDDSPVLQQSTERLHAILTKRASDALSWEYKFIPNETHNSVVYKGFYFALKALYHDWQLAKIDDLATLENHYKRLSTKYGYLINLPEESVNLLGYQFLSIGKTEEAIRLFKQNVIQYGQSSNVYDSLGDAYKVAGQLSLAKASYEKAYAVGQSTNTSASNLASYQNNIAQINKLLDEQAKRNR